jgi:hypothetical protein
MTNFFTMVWLSWITNTIVPNTEGARGPVWYHTNVTSAVLVYAVPGVPRQTNTVPVATNTVRFILLKEFLPPDTNYTILAKSFPAEKGSPSPQPSPPGRGRASYALTNTGNHYGLPPLPLPK